MSIASESLDHSYILLFFLLLLSLPLQPPYCSQQVVREIHLSYMKHSWEVVLVKLVTQAWQEQLMTVSN